MKKGRVPGCLLGKASRKAGGCHADHPAGTQPPFQNPHRALTNDSLQVPHSDAHDPCHPMRPILPLAQARLQLRGQSCSPLPHPELSEATGSRPHPSLPSPPSPPDQKASGCCLSCRFKHLHSRSGLRYREKPERWRKRRVCAHARAYTTTHIHTHTHTPTGSEAAGGPSWERQKCLEAWWRPPLPGLQQWGRGQVREEGSHSPLSPGLGEAQGHPCPLQADANKQPALPHLTPGLVPQRHKVRLNRGRGDPSPRNQQSTLAMPPPWVAWHPSLSQVVARQHQHASQTSLEKPLLSPLPLASASLPGRKEDGTPPPPAPTQGESSPEHS